MAPAEKVVDWSKFRIRYYRQNLLNRAHLAIWQDNCLHRIGFPLCNVDALIPLREFHEPAFLSQAERERGRA